MRGGRVLAYLNPVCSMASSRRLKATMHATMTTKESRKAGRDRGPYIHLEVDCEPIGVGLRGAKAALFEDG